MRLRLGLPKLKHAPYIEHRKKNWQQIWIRNSFGGYGVFGDILQSSIRECYNGWNFNKNQSIRIVDSWMDVNQRSTIDGVQSKNWCTTIDGEY